MSAPERIWIEHGDECPYFYEEDELHEVGSAVIEYVRADIAERENAELRALAGGYGRLDAELALAGRRAEDLSRQLAERDTELARVREDGARLVPVEPTDDMIYAAFGSASTEVAREIYRAMLAAAPAPAGGTK